MSQHTLVLIARSGQENLLRHEATNLLLHLKWRFIPRFAFYFNLIFYLFYMLFFSIYSIQLSNFGHSHMNNQSQIIDHNLRNQTFMNSDPRNENSLIRNNTHPFKNVHMQNTSLFYLLMAFLITQLSRELFQMLFLDGFSYFLSHQNIIEIFTYITSVVALLSRNYTVQSAYGSLAVLCSFLLFPLYIQKLKMFGLYVVAFRRTFYLTGDK